MRPIAIALLASASVACGGGLFSIFDDDGDDSSAAASEKDTKSETFGPAGGDGGVGNGSNGESCRPNLTGLVRDFRGKDAQDGHPDFEAYDGDSQTTGLVEKALGSDRKPVFASTSGSGQYGQQLTSKASFDQWYRNTDGVNLPFEFVLPLSPTGNGVLTFSSAAFFPIDGRGFGNSGKDDKKVDHNFGFTFELHLEFVYRGGEVFTFTGDDDLWTFFNGKLGIDLGGLHKATSATVALDDIAEELGITKGSTYPLDVFHAERHTDKSNFRIDTTLEFVNCGAIILPK